MKKAILAHSHSFPHSEATLRIQPRLTKDLPRIEDYLDSLGLTIHPKKKHTIPAQNGVDFLGAKVYGNHLLPGARLKRNFSAAVYQFATTGRGKPASISFV